MGSRIYIGHLPYRCQEKDVERFFRGYGRIREISMKNGYGFVEFDDYRDAEDAVYELHNKDMMGERVSVEFARGHDHRNRSRGGRGGYRDRRDDRRDRDSRPSWLEKSDRGRSNKGYGPPTRTDYRLIVENLSSRVSWQDLKDYMRNAGEVTYADAHKPRRNEGVVEFTSYDDMKTALDKFDGAELNGKKIRLYEDKPKGRSRSRSRSRSSRSRSRSKSKSRSKSRSRSKSKSRSRSRSHTPSKKRNSRSKSRSKSRSRSRSKSAEKSNNHHRDNSDKDSDKDD